MKVKSPESKPSKSDVTRKIPARNRIKYSAQQLHRLEKVFLSTQYPDSSILRDLSNTLNIDVERLSNWFQNRRSKFKRQAKGSHVSWMRQQLYPQGSSHDVKDHPEKSKCHVLSPPVPSASRRNDVIDKPRSNLHYLPTSSSPSFSRGSEYDPAFSLPSSLFPSTQNIYSALNDAVSCSDPLQSTLQLSYLGNDTNYHQQTSYLSASSGFNNAPTLTSAGNLLYQNYYPPYNYTSAQPYPYVGF